MGRGRECVFILAWTVSLQLESITRAGLDPYTRSLKESKTAYCHLCAGVNPPRDKERVWRMCFRIDSGLDQMLERVVSKQHVK